MLAYGENREKIEWKMQKLEDQMKTLGGQEVAAISLLLVYISGPAGV